MRRRKIPILTLLIGYNLYRLVHQYRIRAPGARLTLRLVAMFVAIALAPLGVVYYFSLQLLQEGIDSWFDVRIEKGLEDALELSRASLDLRIREVLKQTRDAVRLRLPSLNAAPFSSARSSRCWRIRTRPRSCPILASLR